MATEVKKGSVYTAGGGKSYKVKDSDDDGNVVLEETRPNSDQPDPKDLDKDVVTTTVDELNGPGWTKEDD